MVGTSDEFDSMVILKDDRWTIQALATLTLWNWGNTVYKVGENKVKVTQAEDSKIQLIESIT